MARQRQQNGAPAEEQALQPADVAAFLEHSWLVVPDLRVSACCSNALEVSVVLVCTCDDNGPSSAACRCCCLLMTQPVHATSVTSSGCAAAKLHLGFSPTLNRHKLHQKGALTTVGMTDLQAVSIEPKVAN